MAPIEGGPHRRTRRRFVAFVTAAAVGSVAGCIGTASYEEGGPFVEAAVAYLDAPVLYTADCHCCEEYAAYVEEETGVIVDIAEVEDLSEIKANHGVPEEMAACHTMDIGDYFVEGHVPLEAIGKLADERPAIAGISLPGMPQGSPGMTGTKDEEWTIFAVLDDGSYDEFMLI